MSCKKSSSTTQNVSDERISPTYLPYPISPEVLFVITQSMAKLPDEGRIRLLHFLTKRFDRVQYVTIFFNSLFKNLCRKDKVTDDYFLYLDDLFKEEFIQRVSFATIDAVTRCYAASQMCDDFTRQQALARSIIGTQNKMTFEV